MVRDFFLWFSTGPHGPYMRLQHCIHGDPVTLWTVVSLCGAVIIGYLLIARQWHQQSVTLPEGSAKDALKRLRATFILCAFCGYFFPILKLGWPAWKLEAVALAALVYYTWAFAVRGGLSALYDDLRAGHTAKSEAVNYKKIINNLPVMSWLSRPDGFIFSYNQRWFDYTGTTEKEVEGWGWQKCHDPVTLPAVLARWKECLATCKVFEATFPLKGADGVFRDFATRCVPLKGADGKIELWFGSNFQVSETAMQRIASTIADVSDRIQKVTDRIGT